MKNSLESLFKNVGRHVNARHSRIAARIVAVALASSLVSGCAHGLIMPGAEGYPTAPSCNKQSPACQDAAMPSF